MTASLCVGFSKHHFFNVNGWLRTHGFPLPCWTPTCETVTSDNSFNRVSSSDLLLLLTQTKLLHKNSGGSAIVSESEAHSELQLAHRRCGRNFSECRGAHGGAISDRWIEA